MFHSKNIESDIRELAAKRKINLRIITGSLSVLKLKDMNFNDVEIYLDPRNALYPVPEIIYKVQKQNMYDYLFV